MLSLRGTKQSRRILDDEARLRDCFVPRNDNSVFGALSAVIAFLLLSLSGFAQTLNTNAVYRPAIKSVQCYNSSKEGSFPLITLNSGEQITLAFDDLTSNSRQYYYTIQHCEADWILSNMSPVEYLQGFTEDRILNYAYASGTLQKYIHYEVKLPNQNIAPKYSGNYLLRVYEDGNQSQPVLTRRIYVVSPKVNILAQVVPSNDIQLRPSHQKINFEVDYGSLYVQNPATDLKPMVMQNARPETATFTAQPFQIRGNQLLYADLNTNDFQGSNEFRLIDLRTLKLNSQQVAKIYRDTANTVMLLNDYARNQPAYIFQYDDNGNFFIRNADGHDPNIDADYAQVYFSLAANKTNQQGDAYIIGKFNNYQLNTDSKLDFDPARNRFYTHIPLKQGIYDYQYVWVDKATGRPDYTSLEGSHFETENDYQLLVYYHPAGARWDELVGYRLLNTAAR
jgi:hypothetical protein